LATTRDTTHVTRHIHFRSYTAVPRIHEPTAHVWQHHTTHRTGYGSHAMGRPRLCQESVNQEIFFGRCEGPNSVRKRAKSKELLAPARRAPYGRRPSLEPYSDATPPIRSRVRAIARPRRCESRAPSLFHPIDRSEACRPSPDCPHTLHFLSPGLCEARWRLRLALAARIEDDPDNFHHAAVGGRE
jgi:hypothetical protein